MAACFFHECWLVGVKYNLFGGLLEWNNLVISKTVCVYEGKRVRMLLVVQLDIGARYEEATRSRMEKIRLFPKGGGADWENFQSFS